MLPVLDLDPRWRFGLALCGSRGLARSIRQACQKGSGQSRNARLSMSSGCQTTMAPVGRRDRGLGLVAVDVPGEARHPARPSERMARVGDNCPEAHCPEVQFL